VKTKNPETGGGSSIGRTCHKTKREGKRQTARPAGQPVLERSHRKKESCPRGQKTQERGNRGWKDGQETGLLGEESHLGVGKLLAFAIPHLGGKKTAGKRTRRGRGKFLSSERRFARRRVAKIGTKRHVHASTRENGG